MKFSDFDAAAWEENKHFYDTCLLPYTGLTGTESPPEAVGALERLRDFMEIFENLFRGRVVSYPVVQYAGGNSLEQINELCRIVKSTYFRYVVVVSADIVISEDEIPLSDVIFSRSLLESMTPFQTKKFINEKIQELWQKK
ncbi:DUF2487 family protein [Paenibacillus sp. sgz500958]|uniref:DUF2487 family protein n=1 Tax=Paenibacillus sp. sgz500958 TaxID=3242475 RepID=UPI0036D27F8E